MSLVESFLKVGGYLTAELRGGSCLGHSGRSKRIAEEHAQVENTCYRLVAMHKIPGKQKLPLGLKAHLLCQLARSGGRTPRPPESKTSWNVFYRILIINIL